MTPPKVPKLRMFLVDKDGNKEEVKLEFNWDSINAGCMNHDKEPVEIKRLRRRP